MKHSSSRFVFTVLSVSLLLSAGPVQAATKRPITPSATAGVSEASAAVSPSSPSRRPLVIRMAEPDLVMQWKLEIGLRAAVSRLRSRKSCQKLFTELSAVGEDVLANAIYGGPLSSVEERLCRRLRADAFTAVSARRIVLCPGRFESLTRDRAAAVLIHEALHHAGLRESPAVPDAPTSQEINRLVRRHCAL